MIVFEIHYNFLIVLPIPLKTYRSSIVLFFTEQKACARKIGRVSGFWESDQHRACNLSRPATAL